jgi:ribosome-binding protein aMBF1 (putative translation factor)
MTAIKIVAETKDTVTVNRQDWARLLAELEDVEDRAAVRDQRAREAAMGKEAIRQNCLTGDEARRMLAGESPVRVWRGKRGLTQRALAAAAGVAASYLADIENGRKPGSADALSRLARALGVSMDDLMDEQQRRRDPSYGPVYLRFYPHSVGIGPGGRGASPHEQRFASVHDALAVVHSEWPTRKNQSPEIVDEQRLPIFSQEDLWREMEPNLFDPNWMAPELDIKFDAAAQWSGKLSSYVMWATVDGEPIRCRVLEEVFRDCLDDPQVRQKDFPRMFQRHRHTFERALRKAIHDGRFSSWHDREAVKLRREVVLDSRDFHVLVSPRP